MIKLLKHLKKQWFTILMIVALLAVQASCDLALPEYTSKIVNVGIQQGGVSDVTPKVIRKTTLDEVLLFTKEKDKKIITDNFQLLNKKTLSEADYKKYSKKYPKLKEEDLYLRKDDYNKKLDDLLREPFLMTTTLSDTSKTGKQMQQQIRQSIIAQLEQSPMPAATKTAQIEAINQTDIFKLIEQMPETARLQMMEQVHKKLKDMPEMMVEQSSIMLARTEYEKVGMDTEQLQNNYIIMSGLKMIGLALLSMTATILVGLLGSRVAARLAQDLRSKVFNKVTDFSTTEMKHFSTASLITRTTNDITQVQMLMVMLLRVVFYAPIIGVGGVIKVLNTNTSMAWIIAVAVMAILTLVLVLFGIVMPKFKIMQKLVDKLNSVTREILTGIPVIRAFSNQKYECQRFDEANKNLTKTNLFVNRVMSFMMPAMMCIMNIICIVIVWKGAHSINDGMMQVGDMMAFIQYTMQIIMAFLMISMISIMLPRALVSVRRVDEILETDVVVKEPIDPKKPNKQKKGYVEFKDVSFRYPDATEYVIKNISFTAKPGETTAFIGSTGSGKSTLINLIPRFFDATKGEVLVGGENVKHLTTHDLRAKIGFVPQRGVLFSGTIETNLKYGKKDLTQKEMQEAARIAQATEFITSKKEQYQTEIAQGGNNVSGGQKQRLSIARAIAKDPEIYIFDDSFSALDFKTDAALRHDLKRVTKDKTVLIVAQRISTIMNAEQIVVLDEGNVVGIGTHQELLKNCDVYKQIALSQLSKEELEDAR